MARQPANPLLAFDVGGLDDLCVIRRVGFYQRGELLRGGEEGSQSQAVQFLPGVRQGQNLRISILKA